MNRIDRLATELENKGVKNVLSKETVKEITQRRTELQESICFKEMTGDIINRIIKKDGTIDIEGVILPASVQYFILGYYTRMDVEKDEQAERETEEDMREVAESHQRLLDLRVEEQMRED